MEAGARGLVLKTEPGLLVEAVRTIMTGQYYFSPTVLDSLGTAFRVPDGDGQEPHLTTREREVVQAIAEGLGNKQIAGRMGVSVRTVESHRANLMEKLGLGSVGELVRWAIRNEIIDP